MDSIVKPTLVLMAGRILAFTGTFLIPVVLVRVFDQSEFGTYKQVLLIFTTLYHLPQLGMAEGLFYFLPRHPGRAGRFVANSLLFLGGAGLAVLLGLALGAGAVARWMSNDALASLMTLAGTFTGLSLACALLEMVMISRKQYLQASLAYAVSDVGRAVLLVVPALITRSLVGVFVGAAAFAAFRLAATLAYARREMGGGLRPDGAAFREQLAYSLPLGFASVVAVLQGTFHQYTVSYSFDAAAFAVYSVGCLQIPLIEFVAGPAGNVMMVRMTEDLRAGRRGDVLPLWHDTTRRLALVFVPLAAFLVVAAREVIVVLFTDAYLASVPIFMVWSVVLLATVVGTDGVLRVYAETRFLFLLNLARLGLNVVLMVPFLGTFGLLGAVLVTVLAMVAAKGVALARVAKVMGVGAGRVLPWGSLAAIAVASAAAALPALAVERRLGLAPFPLLAATGIAYASVFGVLAWAGLLTPAEKRAVSGWTARVLRRRGGRAVADAAVAGPLEGVPLSEP